MRIPDDRIREIKAAADAATTGPWLAKRGKADSWVTDTLHVCICDLVAKRFPDAAFIAMSRTAIPDLLAEREERIAELGVMLREIERLKKHTVSCSIYEELYTRAEKAEADYQDLFEEFGVQNAELAKHVVIMDEALDALESTEKAGKEK